MWALISGNPGQPQILRIDPASYEVMATIPLKGGCLQSHTGAIVSATPSRGPLLRGSSDLLPPGYSKVTDATDEGEGQRMKNDPKRGIRRRMLGAIAVAGSLVTFMVIAAGPASAAVLCAVSGTSPNQTMTVTLNAADTVTIAVNGANIEWNAMACTPAATTADVSAIVVNADLLTDDEDQTVTIDGAPGDFTASITVDLGAGDDTFAGGSVLTGITVHGGAGNDTITTGAGNDTITTGAGDDTVTGGDGNDRIATGAGNDTVTGGDGNDTMTTGGDDDTVSGGVGNDTARGGAGPDTLSGGPGRDALSGNDGNDTLMGGDGADWLAPGEGDDGVDGNAQRDTVSFYDATARVDVDLSAGTSSTGADDDVLVSIENIEGSDLVDTVRGTIGKNRVTGGGSADLIRGVGGDDTIRGGDGPDTIRGGKGNDRLFGQRASDTLNGGPGVDRCRGGEGSDTIRACE